MASALVLGAEAVKAVPSLGLVKAQPAPEMARVLWEDPAWEE